MQENNFEEKINKLKNLIAEAEKKKIQLETRKDEALKRKTELDDKCLELNIDPSNIESHISKLENSIANSLKKFESLLSMNTESPKIKDEDYDAIF